jgi:hypothetical protein
VLKLHGGGTIRWNLAGLPILEGCSTLQKMRIVGDPCLKRVVM